MKNKILVLLLVLSSVSIYSQSTNFRAQGKYYSAKRSLSEKNYENAISYILECKKLLGNKSNKEIQYVHIIASYKAKNYVEAQKEIVRFFNIYDNIEEEAKFDKTVEDLTQDEVREITKLIDLVDEGASAQIKKEKLAPYNNALALLESFYGEYPYTHGDNVKWIPLEYSITISGDKLYLSTETDGYGDLNGRLKGEGYGRTTWLHDGGYISVDEVRNYVDVDISDDSVYKSKISSYEVVDQKNGCYLIIRGAGLNYKSTGFTALYLKYSKKSKLGLYAKKGKHDTQNNIFGFNKSGKYFFFFKYRSDAEKFYQALKVVLAGKPSV